MKNLARGVRLLRIWVVVIALVSLAACESSGHTTKTIAATNLRGDPQVEAQLRVLDPRMVPAGLERHLAFEIQNASSNTLNFAYAIDWYDRAGNELTTIPRTWKRLTLEPGASCAVNVATPVPEAESWRLRATRN